MFAPSEQKVDLDVAWALLGFFSYFAICGQFALEKIGEGTAEK